MKITVKPDVEQFATERGLNPKRDRGDARLEIQRLWKEFIATVADATNTPGFNECLSFSYADDSFDIDTSKFGTKIVVDTQANSRNRRLTDELALDYTSPTAVRTFHDMLVANGNKLPGFTSLRPQISSLAQLMENIENKPIGAVKNLEAALSNFITDRLETKLSAADFFIGDGVEVQPIRVNLIKYVPPTERNGETYPAYVDIKYSYFQMCDGTRLSYSRVTGGVQIHSDDVKQTTLRQLLARMGWMPSNEDLVARQAKLEARSLEIIRTLAYQQVRVDSKSQVRSISFNRSRSDEADAVKNLNEGSGRAVVDFLDNDKQGIDPAVLANWSHKEPAVGLMACTIPVFHLKHLTHVSVPVAWVQEYQWIENIREKLVLPHDTQDLLDTLTADPDLAIEDIVADKVSSTCVLLMGSPGVGKTLSAEVYAEQLKLPLYRVSSGHLGTNASNIKENLRLVCARANRWKCPILIDECDVFIRARGFDIEQNAIVISFLEALEYTNNLIFMTTNRGIEIDDAIFSRCIAIVRYDIPPEDDRVHLWRVLAPQFFPDLTQGESWASLSRSLAATFDRVAGRDIKMVLILANRIQRKHKKDNPDATPIQWTVDSFHKLVKFRRNPNNDLKEEQALAAEKSGF